MFEGETRFVNSKKIIRGCYSQFWKEDKSFGISRIADYFSKCAGAVFVNDTIKNAVAPKIKNNVIFETIEDATNPNIFYPIDGAKDKNFTAIFVGNTQRKLKNYEKIVEACKKANVNLITCSNIDNKELVLYYNKADICINFSDHEGGPQTFLESGLCGVPMVIREGNDLSKKIPCFTVSNFNDLLRKLIFLKNNKYLCARKGLLARSAILKNFTYSKVSKKFGDLILKLNKIKEVTLKKDLTKELTVFVVSCGSNPNYIDCINSLRNQNCSFNIKYIKDISPMSKAFQKMIDDCFTKYYIQVDEDMILNENSIEKIYESIKSSSNATHSVCYLLKDPHLNFNLYGIKAYKHDVMKNHPYNLNVISCEVEQLGRIEKSGYKNVFIQEVVGLHSPKWTQELIFERYFDLMEKWKVYNYHWMGELPAKLMHIYKNNPTDLNLFAFMGAMTSISSNEKLRNREKNYKIEDKNFKRIKNLISIKSFNHIK